MKWEDICSKCGLCCYQKIIQKGCVEIDLSSPCQYLDIKTNRCTIYEERFKLEKNCKKVNLFRVIFSPYIPPTCSYLKKFHYLRLFYNPVVVYTHQEEK